MVVGVWELRCGDVCLTDTSTHIHIHTHVTFIHASPTRHPLGERDEGLLAPRALCVYGMVGFVDESAGVMGTSPSAYPHLHHEHEHTKTSTSTHTTHLIVRDRPRGGLPVGRGGLEARLQDLEGGVAAFVGWGGVVGVSIGFDLID